MGFVFIYFTFCSVLLIFSFSLPFYCWCTNYCNAKVTSRINIFVKHWLLKFECIIFRSTKYKKQKQVGKLFISKPQFDFIYLGEWKVMEYFGYVRHNLTVRCWACLIFFECYLQNLPLWLGSQPQNPWFLAYLTLLDYWVSCHLSKISWTILLNKCFCLLLWHIAQFKLVKH